MPTPTSAQRGSLKKCRGRGGQPSFSNAKSALNREQTTRDYGCSAVGNGKNTKGVDEIRVQENHSQMADETCWDQIDHPPLTSEGLRQWEMHAHVDHVFDLVPFWQRGMDAAERGEVLRLEEFLEKMEGDGGWRTVNDVLEMMGGWKVPPPKQVLNHGEETWDGWGSGRGWGAPSAQVASDMTESSHGEEGGWGIREDWAEGGSDLKMDQGRASAAQDGWGGRARMKMVRAVRGGGTRDELRHFVDAIARQEAANEERRQQMHLFFEMPMEEKIKKIEETIRFLRAHAV